MGEAEDRIVGDIEQARTALDQDLDALEAEVRYETDWKVQTRRHPWLVLGCAIVLGFLLVKLVRS